MEADAPNLKPTDESATRPVGRDDREPASATQPTVIGIGASAGGLRALQAFFEALPGETGMSFVVIVHLDPTRESQLAELLQAKTEMPVTQVQEATHLEANHVYVIPPSKRLEATDHKLSVFDFDEPRGHRTPIDLFFRSLAVEHGDGAAIILSGGGSDGAVGIKAIKEAGGLVLVQDPKEAEFDAMPRSAIATGLVDRVLPVREMARQLVALKQRPAGLPKDPEALDSEQEETLRRILARLHARSGHDFSEYKRSTVVRRVQRRMQVCQQERLEDYLAYLHDHNAEVQALFKELLIGVTTFFRDGAAFEALEKKVIPNLFADKAADEPVRVWICGCSTGEEAYSVAMLLHEHAATLDAAPKIQLFASDLDDEALATAREGRYPTSIEADVSEERLRRFFRREGDYYRVRRSLRERIVFALHSVLRDPPFSRVDLITCRNVLIYLQPERQQQVFEIFHYALRERGYLFLGNAETAETSGLFQAFDQKHRLYRARERSGTFPTMTFSRAVAASAHPTASPHETGTGSPKRSEETLHRRALEDYAPPSVLVDEQYHAVHLSERVGRYLEPPGGTPTHEITRLVRPELRTELRSALFQAFEKAESTVARPVQVQFNGHPHTVYLTVRLVPERDDSERLALVIFNEAGTAGAPRTKGPKQADAPAVQRLEAEVRRTREQLQKTREEYESSQEELKAQNEELRSMNEEYKSATEELETSKEELQSLNEELQTVNRELEANLEEVSRAHSDLQNLITATDVGTLFLDPQLQIKRFTPQVEDYISIRESDLGRPLRELRYQLDYDELEDDAGKVLAQLAPIERKVQSTEGRYYLVRIRPYRTVHDKIDGVVITFVDITELKETEEELRAAKEYAEMIVDTVREGLLVLDDELRVVSASASFYKKFQVDPKATEGHLIYELGNGQWNLPELRELLEEVLPDNNAFNDFEVTHTFEPIGEQTMLLNARRLDGQQRILLSIEDITERKKARKELHELNETLEERVERRTEQVRELTSRLTMAEQQERHRIAQVLHDDLQQRLYGIQMRMQFLRKHAEAGAREQLLDELQQAEEWMNVAIETTRQLSVDLSPPILKEEGLAEALGWLATQMQKLHGLKVDITAEHNARIPNEDMRIFLFQVIRELLFNVVKHANVSHATVKLTAADDHLAVCVADEGRGFNPDEVEQRSHDQGFGLTASRERLELFGGRLEIESTPGEGTRMTVHTPLNPKRLDSSDPPST